MRIRGIAIQEIRDNYHFRHRFDIPGNSLTGAIFSTLGIIFASGIIFILLFVNLHWILGIIVAPLFCYAAIKEQWRGLLWIQRKSNFKKSKLEYTAKPRVLFRHELYMPKVNGVKVGCDWDIDIDGYRYKLK